MTTSREARERRYGLLEGDYDRLAERSGGRCWICWEPERIPNRSLAIDHCHETQMVRGLLCTRCNQVLGRMKDDADLLRRMADYVEKSRAVWSDCCRDCGEAVSPLKVAHTDDTRTEFGYRCPCGLSWTRGWATRGAMWMWLR